MTQQEQQLLDGLIQRVNSTQLATKDPDAEKFLINALGPNPDAIYILCQTVLVQQFAMENSQHELATLRTQLQQLQQNPPAQSTAHGSFLGNLFGLSKSDPPPPPPRPSAPTGYQPVHDPGPQYPPQQTYPPQQGYPSQQGYPPQGYPPYGGQPGYPPPPGYGAQPMGGGMFGGGGGGFLAGAAQTAAGVVAGEMAFRALEDVFGGGNRGFGGGFGGGGGEREIINNNYYDDSGSRDHDSGSSFGDRLGSADGYDSNTVSSDIEDRRGDSARGFTGGSGDDNSNDTANFTGDVNADDNSGDTSDDSSSYDNGGDSYDGGGSDDSGGGGDDGSY